MIKRLNITFFSSVILIYAFTGIKVLYAQQSSYSIDNDYSQFDRSLIPSGEKLLYEASILGNIIPMGNAQMEITTVIMDSKKYYLFTGKINGGVLGIGVSMELQSYVNYETLRPELFLYTQRGFKSDDRKIVFDWNTNEVVYFRKDSRSQRMVERSRTPILPETRDILSTPYFARSIDPELHNSRIMRFIEKGRHIWIVNVEVIEKKALKLKNGKTYNAVKIKITPLNPKKKANKIFRGLFGIEGNIILWVSEESRIPLLIEGDYPLGLLKIHIQVSLTETSSAAQIEPITKN